MGLALLVNPSPPSSHPMFMLSEFYSNTLTVRHDRPKRLGRFRSPLRDMTYSKAPFLWV